MLEPQTLFYLFKYVIVNWRTAAKDPHSKYGRLAYTTQRTCGHIATSPQISVPTTSKMSIDANTLFWRPNCIGVNAKLKTRFRAKGSATIRGISFLKAL